MTKPPTRRDFTKEKSLESFLGRHEGLLKLFQIILIPLTLGLATFFLSYHNSANERSRSAREQFIKIVDKLEVSMNDEDARSIVVNSRPAIGLPLKSVNDVDNKVKLFLGLLEPKERQRLVLFLYNAGLINHAVAKASTYPGTAGLCHTQQSTESSLYCNIVGSGLSLDRLDLRNQHLPHLKILFSSMRDADFSDSHLYGVELMGSDLSKSKFTKSNLKNAYFISAKLNGSDFKDANLSRAYFQCADLSNADFSGATWSSSEPPFYNSSTQFSAGDKPWAGKTPWVHSDGRNNKLKHCPYTPKSD
jgi:uncharacterized protein YjbI with pentapeptide repeats